MDVHGRDADSIALDLFEIAVKAGRLLDSFEKDAPCRQKCDGTSTTAADLAAEALILDHLKKNFPTVPIIAEETAAEVGHKGLFFLVDPLDGTADFIRGSDEYSVNIALVRENRPLAAVVYAPAQAKAWIAGRTARTASVKRQGAAAWETLATRPAPTNGLVALVSRRHGDEASEKCLSRLPVQSRRATSSALKFCFIASGEADIYVRCGPTMEWDTAAGDHILSVAGGCVVDGGAKPLSYGHHDRSYRNGPFAALGDKTLATSLVLSTA